MNDIIPGCFEPLVWIGRHERLDEIHDVIACICLLHTLGRKRKIACEGTKKVAKVNCRIAATAKRNAHSANT